MLRKSRQLAVGSLNQSEIQAVLHSMWVKTIQSWRKSWLKPKKVILLTNKLRSQLWFQRMQRHRTASSCALSHKSTLSNRRSNLSLTHFPRSTSTSSCQSWTRLKYKILCRLFRLLTTVGILWSTGLPTITPTGFQSTWSSSISNACPRTCARKRQSVELTWVLTT